VSDEQPENSGVTNDMSEIRRLSQERAEAEREAAKSDKPQGVAGLSLDFIAECRKKDELGDSELYSAIHRERFAMNIDTEGVWYAFSDHRWQIDKNKCWALAAVEDVVQAYIRELADVEEKIASLESDENKKDIVKKLKNKRNAIISRCSRLRKGRGRKSMIDMATSNSNPLVLSYDRLDQDPFLLGVKNGVVDLQTGVLRPGRPGDYITIVAPTEYLGIKAKCDAWRHFLLEVLVDQDTIDYVQRLLGYSIIGTDLGVRVFPIFYGEYAQNGKGTIQSVVLSVLGQVAGTIQSEMLISTKFAKSAGSPTPEIMDLKGKRTLFASETEKGQRFATAAVKRYAGGDKLKGRGLQDRAFTEFRPSHTMFLITNYMPHAQADDNGFHLRAKVIPFPFSFVEDPKAPYEKKADTKLQAKLLAEASGILGWLVEGALLFQQMGLATPDSIKEPTAAYRRGEDQVLDFVEACCILDPDFKENATNLYTTFRIWWRENINNTPPSIRNFGDGLKMHFKKEKNGTVTYYGLQVKPDLLAAALKAGKSSDSGGSWANNGQSGQ
jgi:putative DNA primase/helicase